MYEDMVCECGHWYEEHTDSMWCESCVLNAEHEFVPDLEATAEARLEQESV